MGQKIALHSGTPYDGLLTIKDLFLHFPDFCAKKLHLSRDKLHDSVGNLYLRHKVAIFRSLKELQLHKLELQIFGVINYMV